jgi:hypothetical protein
VVETGVAGTDAAAFESVATPFLADEQVTYIGCSTVNTLLAGGSPGASQFQQADSSKTRSLDACTHLVEGSDAWLMTSPLGTPRGRCDEYSSKIFPQLRNQGMSIRRGETND